VARVARPRSPMVIVPSAELYNMFSHLMSRWMTGGRRECRYTKPSKIWQHHRFTTLSFTKGWDRQNLHIGGGGHKSPSGGEVEPKKRNRLQQQKPMGRPTYG
jgi:hypothetical protein